MPAPEICSNWSAAAGPRPVARSSRPPACPGPPWASVWTVSSARAGCARAPAARSTPRSAAAPPSPWSSTTRTPSCSPPTSTPGTRAPPSSPSPARSWPNTPARWSSRTAPTPCWRTRPLVRRAAGEGGPPRGRGLRHRPRAYPGPVDTDTGRVVQPPIMPGWDGYDIRGRLASAFTEHDAARRGPGPRRQRRQPHGVRRTAHRLPRLLGVRAGQGLHGHRRRSRGRRLGLPGHRRRRRRHRPHPGPAGADALCRCGSYGCLAAVASGGAVARRLAEAGVPAASGSDVRDLLAAGHPEAAALAREAGPAVGDVLATVVTLLNPGVLMIAGDLAGTPFLTGVRELLYQRALPRSTAHLDVVTSRLGERAGLVGAGAHGRGAPVRAGAGGGTAGGAGRMTTAFPAVSRSGNASAW